MAVGASDNLSEILALLDAVVETFDFTLPGKDQSLGRDLAVTVASEIAQRSSAALGPDGVEWAPNAPKYARWKAAWYRISDFAPNDRTGQMLSFQSLLGRPRVTKDAVEMWYGTGEAPTRTRTGALLKKTDLAVTDEEKAMYCSPKRPFYALDEQIGDACLRVTADALAEILRSL